jgi:putative molybdopterin biosynthesis protein
MQAQQQFLTVIDRDDAQRRFRAALRLAPLGIEHVPLESSLGRVLADDLRSHVNVPSFDRSNVDGYALRAADSYGAGEEQPRRLRLLPGGIATGIVPDVEISTGTAISIATGGMLPRGADAVVMVEHTDIEGHLLLVRRAVTAGSNITFAGTDIAASETVLRLGTRLTSRETSVLAAIGLEQVPVWRRPRVAILSTGDELIPPGAAMRPGLVYDSNARTLADAVRELGCEPVLLGICPDQADKLRAELWRAIDDCDVVLLSGGTSKGEGDLCYRVVAELTNPGIVAHGVALKPGKPICLAATHGKPVVVLPGFPTSAIFTFHEFLAPVLRRLAGAADAERVTRSARLAVKVNSEIGRTEYLLVGLVQSDDGLAAYPMGKGSGSVTTYSAADGFITIARHEEIVQAGSEVEVQLLSRELRLADLVVMGSHCIGLDRLLSGLHARGFATRFLAVGSMAGLRAAERGECDIAGVHLLDPVSDQYNVSFLPPGVELARGYRRMLGVVYRRGDARFEGLDAALAIERVKRLDDCLMINRNPGSGTRVLIDQLLAGATPPGYAVQPRSHVAVAEAVAQGRADWGMAIEPVARERALGFLPLREEHFDFAMPRSRVDRPAVRAFRQLLCDADLRQELTALGCVTSDTD